MQQIVGDFGIGDYNEDGISLAVRRSDEQIADLRRIGGDFADSLIRTSNPTDQVGYLQGAVRRSVDDAGFEERVRARHQSAGSNFMRSPRASRDISLRAKMTRIKPKAYKAAIAVGALSAGYYIATKGKKDNLYDEVMEEQDFEPGPLSISDFNDVDQKLAGQTSSRRDPLVTAGVVGNLDRNKSSHHKMGTDKYNHLFGA